MAEFSPSQSLLEELSGQSRRPFQWVAAATLVSVVVYVAMVYIAGEDPRRAVGPWAAAVSAALALAVLQLGYVRLAFGLFSWGLWISVTMPAIVWAQVATPTLFAYPVIMLLAGWLLGVAHGYALCAASLAATLGIALAQQNGLLGPVVPRSPVAYWLAIATILPLGMVLLHRLLLHQQKQAHQLHEVNQRLADNVATLTASEAELRRAQRRFLQLGRFNPVPTSFTDLASGHLVDVNPAWERVFGWSRAEAVGRTPLELGFWADMEQRSAVREAVNHAGRFDSREIRLLTKARQPIEVLLAAEMVDQDGRAQVMAVFTDVTERKRIEAEVRELNERLERRVAERTAELEQANAELSEALRTLRLTQDELVQSEKFAALGSLVAGVAHELNTPLGNALMVASSLQDRARELEKIAGEGALKRSALDRFVADNVEATELVQRSLARAADLVQSFQQVTADQSSERRRLFQLHEAVQEVLDTLRPNLRRFPWRLEVDVPADIRLDSFPGPLGQVVINLVMNAMLHAFEDRSQGRVRLAARLLEGGMVELQCSDDGVGIAADVLGRIFDPFFTTKLGRGGNGLGLSIVYRLVTQVLHGQVSVASVPGEGTTFTVRLPMRPNA